MKTVFVVEESMVYEDSTIHAVFSTLERAIAEVNELESRHRGMRDGHLNDVIVYNRTDGRVTFQVLAYPVQE